MKLSAEEVAAASAAMGQTIFNAHGESYEAALIRTREFLLNLAAELRTGKRMVFVSDADYERMARKMDEGTVLYPTVDMTRISDLKAVAAALKSVLEPATESAEKRAGDADPES